MEYLQAKCHRLETENKALQKANVIRAHDAEEKIKSLEQLLSFAPPLGFTFYSADFSMQADGKSDSGRVMCIRNSETRTWWHALPEKEKESTDLYKSGKGKTIFEAMKACRWSHQSKPTQMIGKLK